MTTHPFSAAGTKPFTATHSAHQVRDALHGHFPPEDLEQLAVMVEAARKRRARKGKDTGRLASLTGLLVRAAQPQPLPAGPTEFFAGPVGGDPLEVVLMSGPDAGSRVTSVPRDTAFVVPDHDGGPLFVRPAGTHGPDALVLTGFGRDTWLRVPTPSSADDPTMQATSVTPTEQASGPARLRECRFCHAQEIRVPADAIAHETRCEARARPELFDMTYADVDMADIRPGQKYRQIRGSAPLTNMRWNNDDDLRQVVRAPVDGDVLRAAGLSNRWLVIAWEQNSYGWWAAAVPIGHVMPERAETVALAEMKRAELGSLT